MTEQERKLEKSTAGVHGSLSLGLFATALLLDAQWQILSFVILGAASALSGIYLILPYGWKKEKFLEIASMVQIKHVVWFLGLAALGIGLIRTEVNWLAILGVICACLGYAILIFGILKEGKKVRSKGRKLQETKIEDNTEKLGGISHKDIYSKLDDIENTIKSSTQIQKIGILYALGGAFVILGFSLWPGLLERLGMDTTRFYLTNPVAFIALGSIAMIYAYTLSRQKKKKK